MNEARQLCLDTGAATPWVEALPAAPSRPILQRVTEVVLPQAAGVCATMLLPMLEHLSRQQPQRWLTWVGDCSLSRDAFRDYDLTTDRLRRVNAATDEEVLGYAMRALAAGTSQSVVVALTGSPTTQQLAALETAARQGHCFGIVLRRWG